MPIFHKNITSPNDIHLPKWFNDSNNGDYAWKNEKGELESTDELLLPSALEFVDASVAPPTTADGDIYVLSSGGSVEAGWGSVSLKDWVRYDGDSSEWKPITPQKSSLCYDKNSNSLQSFDGLNWVAIGGGIDNVDTAEKAALSPTEGDFVYDTDLDSLQRYDGSNWTDISKGYGIISVIKDSDNGVPTFYIDLQTAFDQCKTFGSRNTINIYSNISLVNEVVTDATFDYDSLTINFNGFKVENTNANGESVIFLTNSLIGKTLLLNGFLSRENGVSSNTIG